MTSNSVKKIDAGPVILIVSDMEKSREYYQNALGCSHDSCGHTAREGLLLLMHEVRNKEAIKPISSIEDGPDYDIYTYCNHIDDLHDEFVRNGAIIVSAPTVSESGWKELIVQDLDGYKIAFGGN
ncbi:hypothetical protein EBB07_31400 [Paenibacillaceae bacterium]|nr:hypothetical protein EBB07_31400 [Paenibacillaceae bacterium]